MKNFWTYFIGGFFLLGFAVLFLVPDPEPLGHTMTTPDTTGLSAGDSIVQVNIPAELSSNAQIGKAVFETKCAACHGTNAAGQNGVAPPLVHKIYEPSHHSDEAFWVATQNGVRSHHWEFGDMPKVEGLTRGDVKMIAAYVRELQRNNGIN